MCLVGYWWNRSFAVHPIKILVEVWCLSVIWTPEESIFKFSHPSRKWRHRPKNKKTKTCKHKQISLTVRSQVFYCKHNQPCIQHYCDTITKVHNKSNKGPGNFPQFADFTISTCCGDKTKNKRQPVWSIIIKLKYTCSYWYKKYTKCGIFNFCNHFQKKKHHISTAWSKNVLSTCCSPMTEECNWQKKQYVNNTFLSLAGRMHLTPSCSKQSI